MADIILPPQSELTVPNASSPAIIVGQENNERQLNKYMRRGLFVLGLLVVVLGGLAAFVPIQGAVIAPGSFTVETHVKQVGHPTGGVIADIMVRDGQHVKAGEELLRLDDTVTGATAQLTGENYDQLMARAARLRAEREGRSRIQFPAELTRRASDPAVRQLMQEEQRVLSLRNTSLGSQSSQLSERVNQSEAQIRGLQQQLSANKEQQVLIDKELNATRELWSKGYTTLARLNQLERAAVDLKAQAGSLNASIATSRAQIAEIRGQDISLSNNMRSTSGTELTEVETQLAELQRNKIAAEDTRSRVSIRAPQSGIVDKLAFTTIGGVIPPGQTILTIVPDDDTLIVESQIAPRDVDQIRKGQEVRLQLSAFNTRTTPEVEGVVETISADRFVDQKSGFAYYTVRIRPKPESLAAAGNLNLRAGMPVEAFIQTGARSLLTYLTKPMTDQFRRAFRESQ